MFWNKKSKNTIKPASLEARKVAAFYHEVAASAAIGCYVQLNVAKELNTLRSYEVAEMVIDQLEGVTDSKDIRNSVVEMVRNFNQVRNAYMLKRYEVSKND